MFNIDFLNRLREAELELVICDLLPGARILEFGAGTGAQARDLAERGYDVVAIDLTASGYAESRVYPVIDYDGRTIPLPDASIDIVFSSNVLEHIDNFPEIMSEFRRVLRKDGFCVLLMPSVAWRGWTFITGLPAALISFIQFITEIILPPLGSSRAISAMRNLKACIGALLPIGHGTSIEGFSELWSFSVAAWHSKFKKQGFELLSWRPLGLFHTGHMLIGSRLLIQHRIKWSPHLGSAANVYVVRPK